MNECDAMTKIIEMMISEVSNKDYKDKLVIMRDKIKDKKHLEELSHPRHLSIVFFGINIFPFSKNDYIEMAKLL